MFSFIDDVDYFETFVPIYGIYRERFHFAANSGRLIRLTLKNLYERNFLFLVSF